MSIRAYRINSLLFEDKPSFNIWNSEKINSFLENYVDTSSPMIEIKIDTLKDCAKTLSDDDWEKEMLEADIKWAEEKGLNFIEYYCY
jgi:fructose/tagatose bisphosphate aldolase